MDTSNLTRVEKIEALARQFEEGKISREIFENEKQKIFAIGKLENSNSSFGRVVFIMIIIAASLVVLLLLCCVGMVILGSLLPSSTTDNTVVSIITHTSLLNQMP